MNEFDLMKAINDLDDSLLESTPVRPRKGIVIALAAVITLLSVTAVAASFGGVTFQRGNNVVDTEKYKLSTSYYGELPQKVTFEEIVFTYDLAPQTCKDSYYEAIYPELKMDAWNMLAQAKKKGETVDPNEPHFCASFLDPDFVEGSVFTVFEEQSGISLALTPQMLQRQALAGDIVWEDAYYPTARLDVGFYYLHSVDASTGFLESVTPIGIFLAFHMGGYENADDYAVCHIRIPLNEQGVASLESSRVNYYPKEGSLHTEEIIWGDIPMTLAYTTDTTPGYTGRAEAHFCIDGIGYQVSAWDEDGDGDAKQMLMELLEGYR